MDKEIMTITTNDLLGEYRPTWKLRLYMLITLVPLGVAFIIPLIMLAQDKPELTETEMIFFFGVCLLVSMICFFITIFVWLNDLHTVILIYPTKIIKKNYFKERTLLLNHDTQFYHKTERHYIKGIYTGSRDYITVNDGQSQMKFDSNIKNIEGLDKLLIQLELQRNMPVVMLKIKQRQSLAFGQFRISTTGLEYKDKMIQLNESSEFLIKNGELIIKKVGQRGDLFNIPISSIPNMNTFFKTFEIFSQVNLGHEQNKSLIKKHSPHF